VPSCVFGVVLLVLNLLYLLVVHHHVVFAVGTVPKRPSNMRWRRIDRSCRSQVSRLPHYHLQPPPPPPSIPQSFLFFGTCCDLSSQRPLNALAWFPSVVLICPPPFMIYACESRRSQILTIPCPRSWR
jgi:hypothetical protein